MAVIFDLARYSTRDTIAVLKSLLIRAMRGEIRGLALSYRTSDGEEQTCFTGAYKHRIPAEGVVASMNVSWRMTQAQARKGPP